MSINNPPQITCAASELAGFFRIFSRPASIEILLAVGGGEACVCHLEAVLGQRQAYISQQLMALRDAGILASRRDGRFVFYRLADERLLALIRSAASLLEVDPEDGLFADRGSGRATCSCPHCAPQSGLLAVSETFPGTPAQLLKEHQPHNDRVS